MKPKTKAKTKFWLRIFVFAVLFFALPGSAGAASLSLNPSGGTYTVGSTFDVVISLNTEDTSINALRTSLAFPPDKLQIVPGGAERSIITVYSSPPRFDNQAGIVDLQGGIPGGINASNGQVISLTFRIKAVGTAIIKFRDESQVLANDGLGTDVLKNSQNGIYNLVLPPPAGPIVVSKTHPDQATWYANPTALLTWSADEPAVENYSYILNDEPTDTPDDISEGVKTNVAYKNLSDGVRYFHIKSFRRGSWGGTTHFALNIDAAPPAEFPVEIIPRPRTALVQPVVQFTTTDNLSGLSHYELKLIPLKPGATNAANSNDSQPLFIEVESPYVTPRLEKGSYDVIVRAFDKAGNFREQTQNLKIVTALFLPISGHGVELRGQVLVSWFWFWVIAGFFLAVLAYLAWRLQRWHNQAHRRLVHKEIPVISHISDSLEELQKYRKKYGKLAVWIFALLACLVIGQTRALAQQIELAPPLVTTISRNITNEEIFYVGGKTDGGNTQVIIYLQNLRSGETTSYTVESDKKGEWFYRHDAFLSAGNHLLWAQNKLGDQLSPPGPQIQLKVSPTAIQFGASRVSTELLYLILMIIFLLVILVLGSYIVFHAVNGRKKHQLFAEEVRKAEESIKRGFAVLRRDIQEELAMVRKAGLNGKMSLAEQSREDQLLRDLADVEKYVGEEIWEIEKLEDKVRS